jgi:hypothetical protein
MFTVTITATYMTVLLVVLPIFQAKFKFLTLRCIKYSKLLTCFNSERRHVLSPTAKHTMKANILNASQRQSFPRHAWLNEFLEPLASTWVQAIQDFFFTIGISSCRTRPLNGSLCTFLDNSGFGSTQKHKTKISS